MTSLADEITKFANEPDAKGEMMDPEGEPHKVFCIVAFKLRNGALPEVLALEFLKERYNYPLEKNPKVKASDL